MTLSKRERLIAIGLAAAVGLFAFDRFIWTPFDQAVTTAMKRKETLEQQRAENLKTFEAQRVLRAKWNDWKAGVRSDESAGETQALSAILDWAQGARVNLAALRRDRVTTENGFQVMSYNVTGTGSMAAISRLVWAMESAKIPIRISDLQLSAVKEGTDELNLQMNVSTLTMVTDPEKPPRPATNTPGGAR